MIVGEQSVRKIGVSLSILSFAGRNLLTITGEVFFFQIFSNLAGSRLVGCDLFFGDQIYYQTQEFLVSNRLILRVKPVL